MSPAPIQNRRPGARLALALCGFMLLGSCGEAETRTVSSVKAEYAQRFVDGLEFGQAGRIKAASFNPESFVLADVQVDDGPDRLYHADLAEMHVSPDADTLVLEFIGITGADPEHGLTDSPMATTLPVRLPFDVVP